MDKIKYRILPLDTTDSEFLTEILYHMIHAPEGERVSREILQEPQIKQYIEDWETYPGQGFMAIEKGTEKKLGAAWVRYFNDQQPGYGYVKDGMPELSIGLFPPYRGQGIGSDLLASLLESLPKELEGVSLSVAVDNPALQLYEGQGFKTVSQQENSLIMVMEADALTEIRQQTEKKRRKVQKIRRGVMCVALALFLLLSTVGFGPFDLGIYKCETQKNQVAAVSSKIKPDESRIIEFIQDKQILWTNVVMCAGKNVHRTQIQIEPFQYEGNWYMPFYKSFKVHYDASSGGHVALKTAEGPQMSANGDYYLDDSYWITEAKPSEYSGSVKGTLEVKIIGLCSVSKAQKLAEAEILKAIREQVETMAVGQ